MAKGLFSKVTGSAFVPVGLETEKALERVKMGDVIECEWVLKRNPKFLKKFFALIRVGFDLWEPPAIDQKRGFTEMYGLPEKNIERYRSDITITAGYYNAVYDLSGKLRLEPKSIAFGNMSEEEFAQLYSAVIDVILRHVPATYTEQDIHAAVERILGFA
jgi:hypothetical protein